MIKIILFYCCFWLNNEEFNIILIFFYQQTSFKRNKLQVLCSKIDTKSWRKNLRDRLLSAQASAPSRLSIAFNLVILPVFYSFLLSFQFLISCLHIRYISTQIQEILVNSTLKLSNILLLKTNWCICQWINTSKSYHAYLWNWTHSYVTYRNPPYLWPCCTSERSLTTAERELFSSVFLSYFKQLE